MKKTGKILCLFLAVLLMLPSAAGVFAASENVPATHLPARLKPRLVVTKLDFTDQTMSSYIRNDRLAVGNRATMNITDFTLRNTGSQPLSLGSAVFVGDDYGDSEGFVKFDMSLETGRISLGVRNTRAGKYTDGRGIWFNFDADGTLTVNENDTGEQAVISTGVDMSGKVSVRFDELLDRMLLSVNGNVVAEASVSGGKYTLKDKNGSQLCSADGCGLYGSGYFTVVIDGDTDGFVDDLEFTNYAVDQSLPDSGPRNIDYSTWTATDDLGRTVASNEETGGVRQEKYVGLFYFLCWVGAGIHVQDNTKIYLEEGEKGLKKYLQDRGGEAYWAEPYFGYYINTDTWVYRKHAYMLEAAGVDFIFLDVSNGATFDKGHLALFDTWLKIRQEGGSTPQICFFCGDNPSIFDTDISHIRKTVYSEVNYEKYKELFFMWDGKPLIFGNTSGITKESAKWLKDFTVRGNWAWCDKDGYWSWLQEYTYNAQTGEFGLVNGGKGRDASGKFEELAISLGHHPSSSKGRSFVYGNEPNTRKNDFNFSLEGVGEGKCFESQFNAAKSYDPSVLLITGWNEWIAGCVHEASARSFAQTSVKGYMYIDQFNPEFSRDAEPMRLRDGVGFGDNYYYQMCDYIRKFKGIQKSPEAGGQQSIKLNDLSTWDGVGPEYLDDIGDAELRNSVCYDADYRYVNGTGRNDFDSAKVSQDEENLYFLIKCTADVERADGENWMNLYINADNDASTGWEGYDIVVNRSRNADTVSVEKFTDGFASQKTGDAPYYISGEYMVVAVPKSAAGISELKNFTFKWADNSTVTGNVMEFMDLGDAAPNDRYAFIYKGGNGKTVDYGEDTTDQTTEIPDGGKTAEDTVSGAFIAAVCGVSALIIAAAAIIIVKIKRR